MADKHEDIDLTMIEEFERLLTSTEFVSAHDLVAKGGAIEPIVGVAVGSDEAQIETGEHSGIPLPRRR